MNLDGFYFSGVTVKSFKPEKTHLILDFDRTITIGRHLTVWGAMRSMLPSEGQLEYDIMYDKYRVMETENRLSNKDAVKWWTDTLRLFKTYKIKQSNMEKAASEMKIRPGARELFAICNQRNIPIVIISAGIKNIIDAFNQKNGLTPSLTLSTELTFSRGVVNGWKKSSLIHPLNKKEACHDELKKIKSSRPSCILIGDSLMDAKMADGLKIAVLEDISVLEEFKKRFDLVIRGESLMPVVNILESL